jgi:hypothetical protein
MAHTNPSSDPVARCPRRRRRGPRRQSLQRGGADSTPFRAWLGRRVMKSGANAAERPQITGACAGTRAIRPQMQAHQQRCSVAFPRCDSEDWKASGRPNTPSTCTRRIHSSVLSAHIVALGHRARSLPLRCRVCGMQLFARLVHASCSRGCLLNGPVRPGMHSLQFHRCRWRHVPS